MRRLALLISMLCLAFLVTDLAQDGYLGTPTPLPPPSPVKIFFSPSKGNSNSSAAQVWLSLTEFLVIPFHLSYHIVLINACYVPSLVILHFCCSAGGIPLELALFNYCY
jgi:hypothetical protein